MFVFQLGGWGGGHLFTDSLMGKGKAKKITQLKMNSATIYELLIYTHF